MTIGERFYVGSTPLVQVDCVEDITGASTTEIRVKKPSGVADSWEATVTNDSNGTPRYLEYQTQTGELDEAGEWKFQSYVVINGRGIYGTTASVTINELFT